MIAGLNESKAYKLGKDWSKPEIERFIRKLMEEKLLVEKTQMVHDFSCNYIHLGERANGFLLNPNAKVFLKLLFTL